MYLLTVSSHQVSSCNIITSGIILQYHPTVSSHQVSSYSITSGIILQYHHIRYHPTVSSHQVSSCSTTSGIILQYHHIRYHPTVSHISELVVICIRFTIEIIHLTQDHCDLRSKCEPTSDPVRSRHRAEIHNVKNSIHLEPLLLIRLQDPRLLTPSKHPPPPLTLLLGE